jgi:hypothetical protein
MRRIKTLLLLILATIQFSLSAKTFEDIRVSNVQVKKVKDSINVTFEVEKAFTTISDTKIVLQPVLIGEKSYQKLTTVSFPREEERRSTLFGRSKADSRSTNKIAYTCGVKADGSMQNEVTLRIDKVVVGKSDVVYDDILSKTFVFKPKASIKARMAPEGYYASGISESNVKLPKPKGLDYRTVKFAFTSDEFDSELLTDSLIACYGLPIYFTFNNVNINDYHNRNYMAFTKLYDAINKMKRDSTINIRKVLVVGYSSPDGYIVANDEVAKLRTEIMRDRICRVTGIPIEKVELMPRGENWFALRNMVDKSTLKDKDEIARIMDYMIVLKDFNRIEDPVNGDRVRNILETKYAESFTYIKNNFFPVIRLGYFIIVYDYKQSES